MQKTCNSFEVNSSKFTAEDQGYIRKVIFDYTKILDSDIVKVEDYDILF